MARDKPTIRQLEYFLAVAEAESFRGAAERLDVSQPTVTAQISELEKILSLRLFERSRAGARLSPDGREVIADAREVIEQCRALVENSRAIGQTPGGTYRLGVTPTLGPYFLPYLLPALHEKYPELRLFVREDSPSALEEGLRSGRHDFVLMPLPLDSSEFVVANLFREPVRLVINQEHPLAARALITAKDLKDAAILTMEEHHRYHHQIEQLCQRLGARLLRDYQGTSLDALRHMVTMGMGHAFLPALYVVSEIHDQSPLRITEIEGEPVVRTHALAWRPTSPARAFVRRLAGDIRAIVYARLSGVVTTVGL